ncbi:hypothetical protein EV714DRAFT_187429, partial [Schizophyllum commune]
LVLEIYCKTGGKHGKHARTELVFNIAAVSYMLVQLFECTSGVHTRWNAITAQTALLQLPHFSQISSHHFLVAL